MDFKIGTAVDVIAGQYVDKRGVIVEVYQRVGSNARSYAVRITDGTIEAKGSFVAEQAELRIAPIDCPFCGSPGYAREHEEMKGSFMAGCSDSDCIAHLVAFDFVSPETAIAAWNTRVGRT